jgi:hypothetical protein
VHGTEPLHVYVSPTGLNLYKDDADALRVRDTIEAIAKQTGLPVRWVIVDTVAKAMPGANENDSRDMGMFVDNPQKIERAARCLVTPHFLRRSASRYSVRTGEEFAGDAGILALIRAHSKPMSHRTLNDNHKKARGKSAQAAREAVNRAIDVLAAAGAIEGDERFKTIAPSRDPFRNGS